LRDTGAGIVREDDAGPAHPIRPKAEEFFKAVISSSRPPGGSGKLMLAPAPD
jgi:hypothetical protein